MHLLHASFLLFLALTLAARISDGRSKFHIFSHFLEDQTQKSTQLHQRNAPPNVRDQLFGNFREIARGRGTNDIKYVVTSASKQTTEMSEKQQLKDQLGLDTEDRQSGGLNGDPCRTDSTCAGSRQCVDADLLLTALIIEPCSTGTCVCAPLSLELALCTSDVTCSAGEKCFGAADVGFQDSSGLQICVSVAAIQELQVSTSAVSEVCIASHSLRHIPKEHLIYKNDILANVLCDSNDSCATAGHMVLYKSKSMMMKSYCEFVGCVQKIMKVNSPKYQRGIAVASRSYDLKFTLFSARYATQVEEGFLSIAVKLGL